MGRGAFVPLVLALAAAPSASAGDIPKAVVVLDSLTATLPDQVPEAAPPRFVLLEDGQVFVGGTSRLAAGRLAKPEAKDITVAGDPAEAPPANLLPLARLVQQMLRFDHPSLRPFRPGAYAVVARE